MRIRSVHYIAFIMLLVYCLIGCNSTVFDDLGGCPQGVYFQFYRQTPCEQFPGYPSDIREVGYLSLMMMICWWANFSDKEAVLSADYSLSATLRHTGKLHVCRMGWRDLEAYDFQIFGKALLPDRNAGVTAVEKRGRISSAPGPLYVSLASYHWKRKDMGSVYEQVAFNMQELTCRYTSQSVP